MKSISCLWTKRLQSRFLKSYVVYLGFILLVVVVFCINLIHCSCYRDMIISKAILSSWGWLSAEATHLGFSPLTELTYPLVTQGSVTDGQTWTFTTYQLNTVDLSTNTPDQTRQQFCFQKYWQLLSGKLAYKTSLSCPRN